MWFLNCEDRLEVEAAQAVAKRAQEIRQHEAEQLAVLIANKVGAMLGG